MNLFRKLSIVAAATALLIGPAAASPSVSQAAAATVAVDGSTALLPLTQQAGKEFTANNPSVSITATGSSSAAGAQAVNNGTVQIGASDWDASKDVPGFKGIPGLVAHKIAVIPFATVVNKNVAVSDLTQQQLKDIFTGKITNWSQVGGANAPIVIVNRAVGSGSRVNYQEKVLGGAAFVSGGTNYKEVKSSSEVYSTVSTTPNAIGYVDLVYVQSGVKALKYNGVEPTVDNVLNKKYPNWSYGYYLTKGPAAGDTKAFIDYVQSAAFQQGSLKQLNFIPYASVN